MPTDYDKKLEAKIAAQQKLADEITELKQQQARAKKAQREKDAGRIGRLAVAAGLDQFDNVSLQRAFEKLAHDMESGAPNRVARETEKPPDASPIFGVAEGSITE